MLDSGTSSHFIQHGRGMKLTMASNKSITTANGDIMHATGTAELPIKHLKPNPRQAIIAPGLHSKALMSVSKLANVGYTTIFHPHNEGVTVHDFNDFELTLKSLPLLQGWRQAGALWTVLITEQAKVNPALDISEQANNVYELPLTSEIV